MATPGGVPVADDLIHASGVWYARLTGSERNGRVADAVLSAMLVLVGSIVLIAVSGATPYNLTGYFLENGSTVYFEAVGLVSILAGILYYTLARRRLSRYADLSQMIERAKAEGERGMWLPWRWRARWCPSCQG